MCSKSLFSLFLFFFHKETIIFQPIPPYLGSQATGPAKVTQCLLRLMAQMYPTDSAGHGAAATLGSPILQLLYSYVEFNIKCLHLGLLPN